MWMGLLGTLALLLPPTQEGLAEELQHLLERLGSDQIEERARAADSLRKLGGVALPALRRAIVSGNKEVSVNASIIVRTLEIDAALSSRLKRHHPDLVNRLALDNGNWSQVLLELSADRASTRLDATLAERFDFLYLAPTALREAKDPGVRSRICELIGNHGWRSAIPEVVACIHKTDSSLRQAAIDAVEKLDALEAVPALTYLLSDADLDTRSRAARALGVLGARGSAKSLLALTSDTGRQAREEAAVALGKLMSWESIPSLQALLNDVEVSVRLRAAVALAQLRPRACTQTIVRRLAIEESPEVRPYLILAIGEAGDQAAVPVISSYLEDPRELVRMSALSALGKLEPKEAIRAAAGAIADRSDEVQAMAIYLLGCKGAEQYSNVVRDRLAAKAGFIRSAALGSLAAFHDKRQDSAALALVDDPDARCRVTALKVLGRLRGKEFMEKIRVRIADPEVQVRTEALSALSQNRAPGIDELLLSHLFDSQESVRLASARALCVRGRREGISQLLESECHASLCSLNALRSPAAWKRLMDRPVERSISGSVQEVVNLLSAQCGLKMDWLASPLGGRDESWKLERSAHICAMDGISYLEALEKVLQVADFELIVEDGLLQGRSREDAREFWRNWAGVR